MNIFFLNIMFACILANSHAHNTLSKHDMSDSRVTGQVKDTEDVYIISMQAMHEIFADL